MRKLTAVTISMLLLFSFANLQAAGKGGNKGGGGNTTTPFVDGFKDSITPNLLCPWEQLNACEGRKEVFVLDETKRANGDNYFWDDEYDLAQANHVDVCMNESDAPTGITLYGLSPKPIDLGQESGCETPCNMLVIPPWTNRASCHENIRLDQSQDAVDNYGLVVLQEFMRRGDNFFCHPDHLPLNVSPGACLASTSRYCYRGLQSGESGAEYEAYLDQCLNSDWLAQ